MSAANPTSLRVLMAALKGSGLGAVGGAVSGAGLSAYRSRGTPEMREKALRGAARGARAGALFGAGVGATGGTLAAAGQGLVEHARYLRDVVKTIDPQHAEVAFDVLTRAKKIEEADAAFGHLGGSSVAASVGGGGLAALKKNWKKESNISLSSAIKGTSAALSKTGLTGGMTALKTQASTASKGLGALKTNTLKAGKTGAPWAPKLGSVGGIVGAVGGGRGAGDGGLSSMAAGAAVGGVVGDRVLPAVYKALLGDPTLSAVALPAALLASGIAGEVSGIVVSKFFKKSET